MRLNRIGNSELKASVVGLGTFEIGGSSWWDSIDDARSIDAIDRALSLGINFLDTAPVYGFGHSERLIGRVLSGRRQRIILSTKVGEDFSGAREGRYHYSHDGRDVYTCLKQSSIIRQVESSLVNLGTDYIDILTPHFYFDDPRVGSIDEVVGALEKLRVDGKIRYFGLSNISATHFKSFFNLAPGFLVAVQRYRNILDALADDEVADALSLSDRVSGLAINTLAKGLLTGAIPNDFQVKAGTERSECPWFLGGRISSVNDMLSNWAPLREKYGVDNAGLAIAWALQQEGISHAIVGATAPSHIESMVKAGEITLQVNDLKYMQGLADNLRAELVEKVLASAYIKITEFAQGKQPIVIWGAGVTLDYISRRFPLDDCNIIGVVDSNPSLHGQLRFGCEVKDFPSLSTYPDDAYVLVAIPSDPSNLDAALARSQNKKRVLHLGEYKALCK
jgi:methylglyoxal reductase